MLPTPPYDIAYPAGIGLRHFTPTQGVAGTTIRDMEPAGVPLKLGDRVFMSFAGRLEFDVVVSGLHRRRPDREVPYRSCRGDIERLFG